MFLLKLRVYQVFDLISADCTKIAQNNNVSQCLHGNSAAARRCTDMVTCFSCNDTARWPQNCRIQPSVQANYNTDYGPFRERMVAWILLSSCLSSGRTELLSGHSFSLPVHDVTATLSLRATDPGPVRTIQFAIFSYSLGDSHGNDGRRSLENGKRQRSQIR